MTVSKSKLFFVKYVLFAFKDMVRCMLISFSISLLQSSEIG